MNKLAILEMLPFYRQSPESLRAAIIEAAEYARLPPDAFFYHVGDICGHFAVVGRGSIRVFKIGETGREVTLYHVQDGEPCLVNMLCVMLGKPAMATAQVEIATEAVMFPGAVLREWVGRSGPMRSFIFETMATRVVDVMTLVEEIAFHKMDSRLAALLLQRFATLHVISATHEDIAAELGTVREVVSRLLKEFVRRGAIQLARGHLELRDEAILRQLI
jgi:CRP/FNR family transcriptional regulator, anaerobic regulatory protein